MKTINGAVRYKGKVYTYSAQIIGRPGNGNPFKISNLSCSDGRPVSIETASDKLLHLLKENARLLKWCADEGWQSYPSKGEPSGFAKCPDGYIQRIRKANSLEPPETMTDPIVVEVLNWAEELVGEPVYYKGGVDQFLGSGKYEAFVPYEEPSSVLKDGALYFGENGMIICCKCAGVRESSGVDSSGNSLVPVGQSDMAEFKKMFGEDISCEKGCTVYAGKRG